MSSIRAKERMDVERLVTWALRDQGLGWAGAERIQPREGFAELGTVIDGEHYGSHPTPALLTDDDALVVRGAIDRLPHDQRVLVILHGRAGTRPEGADEDLGEPEQMRNKRGQLMWQYAVPGNRRSARRPLMDMLAYSSKREGIKFARDQWWLWWQGLAALVGHVNVAMQGHMAIGPEAPPRPWEVSKPVIHGLARFEASDKPQPWLANEPDADDRLVSVEERRAAANAPVRSVARDWSHPDQPESNVAVDDHGPS